MGEKKIRTTPRISVNKLAEYMVASASRRRGIIRDQKQPLDAIVARYGDVYEAVVQSLVAGGDVTPVHERLEKLYKSTPKTVWQAQNMQLSAEALEAFLDFVDEVDLGSFNVVRGGDGSPPMKVAGVDVSVRPELHLRNADGSAAGVVKLYISKNNRFAGEAVEYAGTIVHQYADDVLANGSKIDHRRCYVVDIFAHEIHVAPRTFRRRRSDVAAACEEIAQRWPAI